MYLKTLELTGFKSFPDKTVIEFDKGMTAIVGANGSGKSNISDAVRWVLGEMSARSLRGNKMEDVIFNGTARRKPANFAEVIMTIDNSDYLMKIDFDEVSVGRRLYRTGESEYTLNGKKTRLKDVVDLFLNTGIGREGYSVISQGKISEIISLKGNERRELFEEAAGISRFRYRKSEAAQKLVSVTENAARIGDILSEVQSRIPKLESQSEKAKEYIALSDEKRVLEFGLWKRGLAGADAVIAKEKTVLSEKEAIFAKTAEKIDAENTESDALYVEIQKCNLETEDLRGEINTLADEANSASTRLSVLENEIRHIGEKRTEIKERKKDLSGVISKAEEDRKEAETNLAKASDETERVSALSLKNSEDEKNIREKLAETDADISSLTKKKAELEDTLRSDSLMMKETEGMELVRLERRKVLSAEKENAAAEMEKYLAGTSKLTKELELKKDELKKEQTENGKLNLFVGEENEKLADLNSALDSLRLEKLEANQRRDTLCRMERLLEGFSESVKEIMNASGKTLSGICGPVSKLISTKEEYVPAIETALAGGVQNIICESETDAKKAIAFLKSNRFGRATFLPLDTVRGGVWRTDAIKNEDGFIGVASEICRFDEKYAPAVEHLLGKVIIASDIDSAAKIARVENYGVKVVTLDGQVINAGGSFTGGQTQNKTGVLSRTGDIARLSEKLEEIALREKDLREKADAASKSVSASRKSIAESDGRINALQAEISGLTGELAIIKERTELVRSSLQKIGEEESELELSAKKKEELSAEFAKNSEKAKMEAEKAEKELARLLTEKTSFEKKREELLIEKGEISALSAKAQMVLENAAATLTETENRIEEAKSAGENSESELSKLDEAERLAERETECLAERKEKLTALCAEKRAGIEKLTEKINALNEKRDLLRSSEKELVALREELIGEIGKLRGIISGAAREKEEITAKLSDEYDLTSDCDEFLLAASDDPESLGGEKKLSELRRKIRAMGPVNLDSVKELEEARERFTFLNDQYSDIIKSKEELESLITDLETKMREMFADTFEQVRISFSRIFTELFGGGAADIELTDKNDLLNCGVEIKAQPPGKAVKNLSLLSGGEQAFVAIALYMALLEINPSPFCIFDEIESALDEANVKRFAKYITSHNDKTQFIVITHRRGTMEEANTLYGIAMQEKGVSDFLRLESDSIGKYSTDK